jgi:hypothetical protein
MEEEISRSVPLRLSAPVFIGWHVQWAKSIRFNTKFSLML